MAMKTARPDDDDRVDEAADGGDQAADETSEPIHHALEQPVDERLERAGDVDRDALLVEPRLDLVEDRRWVRGDRGNAAARLTSDSAIDVSTFTTTIAPITMIGTSTATTATGRGRRVRRRWSQSAAGDMRNASNQAKKKIRMIRR
jgi:hypothetical protein